MDDLKYFIKYFYYFCCRCKNLKKKEIENILNQMYYDEVHELV